MGLVIGLLAADDRYGIGKDNSLPWEHHKEDMKFFYRMTVYNPVVMGRKTWDSLPDKSKPLSNRSNYVLTRGEAPYGAFKAPDKGIYTLGDTVYVIGGVDTLKHYHSEIDAYIVVNIDGEYDCDTFFYPPLPTEMSIGSVESGNGLDIHLYTRRGLDDSWVRQIVNKIQSIK